MKTSLAQTVEENGYAFIPRYHPHLSTIHISSLIGSPLTLPGFSTVQELKPREQSSTTPNTYSGNFGIGEFPMHTDLAHWAIPPRYLILRCIHGAPEVITSLLDGNSLVKNFGSTFLRRVLMQPRRPILNQKQILRIMDYTNKKTPVLRWDSIYLKPATTDSKTACEAVSNHISIIPKNDITLLTPGDTLIINNWRMIHRRSSVPTKAINRKIERVYIGEIN